MMEVWMSKYNRHWKVNLNWLVAEIIRLLVCNVRRVCKASKIKGCVALVTLSCPIPCDPMHCTPLGSSVHGILQARILEWVAMPFSRGSSSPRDQTWVSCMAGSFFTDWATREAPIVAQIKTLTWNGKWFQLFYYFYLNIRNLWWTKNMHKEVFYRKWRI